MAKKRASLSDNNPLDNMFSRSAPREEKPTTGKRKRPPKPTPPPADEEPKTVQTTVIFTEAQLEWLDFVSFDSKRGNGRMISKSELLREIVELLRGSDLSLRDIQTSEDIQRRLRESLIKF